MLVMYSWAWAHLLGHGWPTRSHILYDNRLSLPPETIHCPQLLSKEETSIVSSWSHLEFRLASSCAGLGQVPTAAVSCWAQKSYRVQTTLFSLVIILFPPPPLLWSLNPRRISAEMPHLWHSLHFDPFWVSMLTVMQKSFFSAKVSVLKPLNLSPLYRLSLLRKRLVHVLKDLDVFIDIWFMLHLQPLGAQISTLSSPIASGKLDDCIR